MSRNYKDFSNQKYSQDFTNSCSTSDSTTFFNKFECQDQHIEDANKHNNPRNFMSAQPMPNMYMSYCNMPPSYPIPPPPCPPFQLPEHANYHSKYSAPESGHYIQQDQYIPQFQSRIAFQDGPNVPPQNVISQERTIISSESNIVPQSHGKDVSSVTDKMWIDEWLKHKGKSKGKDVKRKETTACTFTDVKVYEIRDKVMQVAELFTKLENLSKSLSITCKSLNDNEWILRCTEIEEKKKEISDLLNLLGNKEMLLRVKYKLERRKKKRERQKRKREEFRTMKTERDVRRQQLHQSIDQWLENMKDDVERSRRDEELKREADSVLADITRKKVDAKRQISLLSALIKLRQARVTARMATGQNISQQQTDAFNGVIERLKSLWENQLKGYLLEEQGLKVMLNEAAAEEKNSEVLKKKEAVREWEKTLFGCSNRRDKFQPRDINELITVRNQWDQFVVSEGTIMSSSVPSGWVIPLKASDSNWMKCTTND